MNETIHTGRNQKMFFALGVLLLALLVFGVTQIVGGNASGYPQGKTVIVKPDNPNDPKFKPSPEFVQAGIGGGGAASSQ